jgi:hypothetical protein
MYVHTIIMSVLYTAYNDLYGTFVWLEECLESFFSIVKFEAVGNQLLRIDELTSQEVRRISQSALFQKYFTFVTPMIVPK